MPNDVIVSVRVDNRISTKSNKPYSVLVLEFINGYVLESFLTNEQKFIISEILK